MNIHNHNLNIHYTTLAEIWDKLNKLYFEMLFWNGFVNGCPQWYGNDEKLIEASVEPSGLQFYAKLPEEEWNSWFELFKSRASELLGFQVGESEDGFEFSIYN